MADENHLTPEQARARFGDLTDKRSGAHREFEAEDGAVWRPRLERVGGKLTLAEYRLWRPPARTSKPAWRPRGKR